MQIVVTDTKGVAGSHKSAQLVEEVPGQLRDQVQGLTVGLTANQLARTRLGQHRDDAVYVV